MGLRYYHAQQTRLSLGRQRALAQRVANTVIGPLQGELPVRSLFNDPKRTYVGGWISHVNETLNKSIRFADYNVSVTGGQYYELLIEARTESRVSIEIISDQYADGGTGDMSINGQTVAFDAQPGPHHSLLLFSLNVPAGLHTLRVRKLLRQSLYVADVIITSIPAS